MYYNVSKEKQIKYDCLLDAVKVFYSDNPKYYHTIFHVKDLFLNYEVFHKGFKEEADLDEESLLLAIQWHDAKYNPKSKTKEEDSLKIAKENSLNPITPLVEDIIMSTVPSNKIFDTHESKVMHDLDWGHFKYWKDLKRAERKIIFEAVSSGFDIKLCLEKQLEFYEAFKDKNLYLTKKFKLYNDIAKLNMNRAVSELKLIINNNIYYNVY